MHEASFAKKHYRHLLVELALIAIAWLGLAMAAASLAGQLARWPAVGMGLLAMLCAGLLMRPWANVLAQVAWLHAMGTADESHR